MEVIAYSGGFQLYLWLRRRRKKQATVGFEQNMWVIAGAVVGALVGSKVLAWAESWPVYWEHRGEVGMWLGGKTVVGGLLGGWAGVEVGKMAAGVRTSTGDGFVFPLIFGMAVGRVGCFLTGLADHTYGVATPLPWGVDFGDGVRRHPTQIYEILFLLALGTMLWWRAERMTRNGELFRVFVMGYLAMRLAIEFIKPTHRPYGGLSAIQVACGVGMAICGRWLIGNTRGAWRLKRWRDDGGSGLPVLRADEQRLFQVPAQGGGEGADPGGSGLPAEVVPGTQA